MYKTKSTKTKNTRNVIFLSLFVLLLGLLLLEKTGVTNFYEKAPAEQNTSLPENPENLVNYSPPTETEVIAGNEQKQKIVDKQTQTLPDTASVVIVDANQYGENVEVRAFISNVIEDGKCKITFTKDSLSFEKEILAYADASTTPCVTLTLKTSEFKSSGTWKIAVAYSGKTVTGSSSTSMEIN